MTKYQTHSNVRERQPLAALAELLQETDQLFHGLAEETRAVVDDACLALWLGLDEIAARWEKTQGAIDAARVRAHLAKADAADAVHALRGRLRVVERRSHDLKVRAERRAIEALDVIATTCRDLAARLDERPTTRYGGPSDDGDADDFDGRA